MALFPNGAADAFRTPVSTVEALVESNEHRRRSGAPPIQIGTEVQFWPLILRMVEEEQRRQGSVISDVVNTASRLEGLTKLFQATAVLSEEARMSDDSF